MAHADEMIIRWSRATHGSETRRGIAFIGEHDHGLIEVSGDQRHMSFILPGGAEARLYQSQREAILTSLNAWLTTQA